MKKKLLGRSEEDGLNLWQITCGCGRQFQPPTTILRFQWVSCPECLNGQKVDYNKPGEEI